MGLGALEVVYDKGQTEDWLNSRLIVDLIIIAVTSLIAAVIWELRHPDPIINFRADGSSSDGPHPERADYGSFAQFRDPDGNSWLLQERGFAG